MTCSWVEEEERATILEIGGLDKLQKRTKKNTHKNKGKDMIEEEVLDRIRSLGET
jgi:hypothetical protein